MRVEQALGTQTVERLSRGDKVVPVDADAYVLLLSLVIVRGGHAGAICLTLVARLFTGCAVTTQSCEEKRHER